MEKKIKITYIIPSLNIGGAERFNLDLIDYLDLNIFEPQIILFKDGGDWFKQLKDNNKIKCFVLKKKSGIDFKNIWQIYRILKQEKPDIVHTQLGGDLRGRLAALLAKIKIILATEQNINRHENFFYSLCKSLITLFSTETISISEAVKKDSQRRYFLAAHKYQKIISNGVNLKKFPYLEKKEGRKIKQLGTASRLVEQKGLDLLIKAWSKAKIDQAQLLIGGSGPEMKNLQNLVNKYQLSQQIKFIGPVENSSTFYQSLDLFIMPSRWEGLGISALEAAASGTPLLLSRVDGLKEIFNDNEAWFIKDINQIESDLTRAVKELDTNMENKRQAAYQKIASNFSINIINEQYLKLYQHHLKAQKNENTIS
ncbi:MAG: glycosyltransferase [Patescibacteria group bacterium]|jgi:glycosyltransferase involved in cell wall biosynthesis|nr:glycosyltransferase [Patescibacteria group bacterium]